MDTSKVPRFLWTSMYSHVHTGDDADSTRLDR